MLRRTMLAAAAAFLLGSGPAPARPLVAKDVAMMERASSPAVSPDGRYVAYAVRSTDWEGNKGINALHLIDLKGDRSKSVVLLKDEKGPPAPHWSPDGKWLYFLSSKSGSSQLWRSRADGSGRQQMTAFPVDIGGYVLAPDGHTLVVGVDMYPDCATLTCTKDRDEARAKEKASGILIKSGQPRSWDSYVDEKYNAIYALDLNQPGAPADGRSLIKDFTVDVPSDSSLTIAPDGRTAYFSTRDPASEAGSTDAVGRIYKLSLDGSAAQREFLGRAGTSFDAPALSPDGRSLAYLQSVGAGETYRRSAVMILDLKTGRSREIATSLDASLNGLDWSRDGRTLYAAIERLGQVELSRIDVGSGSVTALSGKGTVSGFDAAGGAIVFARDSLQGPAQLYLLGAAGEPTQLTNLNAAVLAAAPVSPSEQFSFAGWNNETVYGYVTKPTGYVEGRKYPVAFLIHGGPQSSFGNAWSYRWNPQIWAGMGYAVVTIDFHGSSGYGEKFSQSIIGHWGDRPLEDLQKGWAFAQSRYPYLDGSRACALGGSYGGYMVAWIASQWSDPWKCLVNHAGVFDVRSMANTQDSRDFIHQQFGAPENRGDYERFNPSAFVTQWKKPMLVIHGGRDFRVPVEQGIAAHNSARRQGVTTELLIFPDENHWVLKPQNSVQWYKVVKDWMDRFTGGSARQEATAATK